MHRKHSSSASLRIASLTCTLVLVCLCGCGGIARQTGLMSQVEGIDATTGEMRERTHDATVRFAIIVAETGQEIMLATDDPTIRRNALRWKIAGVSMVHRAGFHFDPFIGLLDLGALSYQMNAFFTTGPGKDAFGPQQPLVLDGLDRITAELQKEARAVIDTSRLDVPRDFVRTWAAEHPLTEPYELRTSVAPELMSMMKEEGRSALATVGTMAQELSALSDRLTIYAEHVPHQARWQAELFLDERGLDGRRVEKLLSDVSALREAVEAMTPAVAGRFPVTAQVDLSNLQPQLQSYFDTLRAFGRTTMADLQVERDALTNFLRQERVVIMQDIGALSDRVITAATDRLLQALTGWIWAGVLILLLLLAVPFWLGLLTGRVMLRRSSP
jgi:hypothetical protein